MDKRTILAILLTGAVWVVWFAVFKPESKAPNPAKQVAAEAVQNQSKSSTPTETAASQPAARPSFKTFQNNLKEEKIHFKTDQFEGVLTSKGAAIEKMTLVKGNVPVTVPDTSFQAKGIFDFSIDFSRSEFLNGNDLDNTVWQVVSNTGNDIDFATQIVINKTPVEIHKHYLLKDKGDSFTIKYSLINKGKEDFSLPESSLIISPADLIGPKLDYTNRYNLMKGIYSKEGSYKTESKGSGFFSKSGIVKDEQGSIDWVGVSSRYLLVIMLPENGTGTDALMDNRPKTGYRTGLKIPISSIKAGSAFNKSFTVYVGYKDKARLQAVSPKLKGAADINLIIEPIRYFVLWCLMNINKLFGNIGWSLVVFSVLTKLVFMPLTNKSTTAMKKMQALTPKINEIKAKYKDKPDVMQKETMKLYSENKVNPLSGCLPIVVQMPFFFALYSALINSIDLWHAPFIFWIKDLSMPDTIATISGFNINLLPILMTITTFFQQKLSTVDTGQSKQQKLMMTFMPLIFIFIFWKMPSGLVLYWTLQNLFQIVNQLVVNKFGKESTN